MITRTINSATDSLYKSTSPNYSIISQPYFLYTNALVNISVLHILQKCESLRQATPQGGVTTEKGWVQAAVLFICLQGGTFIGPQSDE